MKVESVCVDASFVVRLLIENPEESPYQLLWDKLMCI